MANIVVEKMSFLRLMVCILFLPGFLLMNQNLPREFYYVAGFTFLYALILFLLARLKKNIPLVFFCSFFIDLILISFIVYYGRHYGQVLAGFYFLPIISMASHIKPYPALFTAFLAGLAYLFTGYYAKFSPALMSIQVILFFILALFTWAQQQSYRQTYFTQANLDTLTKIHNRRFFNHALSQLVDGKIPFSLLLLDLDDFKILNDTQGHHHGDYVLKIVAATIKECTRSSDISSRYGGDEFAIILPHTSKEDSKQIAERIRNKVLIHPKFLIYSRISLSIGIAAFPDDAHNPEGILQKADEALYKAKERGKNYVYVY
ncbi:MAG: GGDEF domain-containing protein [Bacillota bacterium]|uniref:Diguanylate cyclase n=1 Tax=Thermanaerosceptrum fracticalcis TaxID=1712410 RepID=A0A7G6E2C4_THEFR|nr:GGDEF domain-containing protein [Thermanaerosceptrum fracticalcis]QNB46228.1 diguanylate cyclase [Thermanaerosceptrum fracticalcis]